MTQGAPLFTVAQKRRLLLDPVLATESIDTASSVHQLLPAGIERVAG